MRKIPTLYLRDWEGLHGPPGRLVTGEPNPECDWVFAGEGAPTQKLDGTSCYVIHGQLYKRLEKKVPAEAVVFDPRGPLPIGVVEPESIHPGFIAVDANEVHGEDGVFSVVGWVPVGDGPEDKWHREAWSRLTHDGLMGAQSGTYELLGPKVQGNPEGMDSHVLVKHEWAARLVDVPTDLDGLGRFLTGINMEGVVWHHPDGRMAKIKGKDIGVRR